MQKLNVFQNIPAQLPEELFETFAETDNVRIERIISRGHVSQGGYWYDQDWNEWVILLAGHAKIEFEDPNETIELNAGDHLNIPKNVRHRVIETSVEPAAVWVAVSFNDDDSE